MPAARSTSPASKLAVAVDATPLLGVLTGVGSFCRNALQALSLREELDVSAFAVTWRRREWLGERLPRTVPARQRAMPARPLRAAWLRSDLPPAEWFVGQVDVVHGTNFVVPPTRHAAEVVTVHDLTPVRFPEMCEAPTLEFPRLVRRALRRGAFVHAPSRYVADEVVEVFGADRSRVRCVWHGVPPPVGLPGTEDEARAALALPATVDRYILAVGTVEPRKDYPGLVRAFDALCAEAPGVGLVIVGGDGWGSAELSETIGASPFKERIFRCGYLPDAALATVRRWASLVAYPSLYEGFGFPPLEAMAAGVPVVATAAGALPEVLGDAAELVRPGDPDALAGALARVLSDDGRRRQLLAKGFERTSLFSWEASAAGLAALYRDAAAGKRPLR